MRRINAGYSHLLKIFCAFRKWCTCLTLNLYRLLSSSRFFEQAISAVLHESKLHNLVQQRYQCSQNSALTFTSVRPAAHLWSQSVKNENCIAGYFTSLFTFRARFFFAFCAVSFTFCISQHFAPGSAFARKVKWFRDLFFCGINKARNLHEIWKVYSECFVFPGVFRKTIHEIPAKCEIRKVYSQPKNIEKTVNSVWTCYAWTLLEGGGDLF